MDLGHVPEKVELAVSGSDYFVFESNHDVDMEKTSGRPNYLIRRVLGNLGHLSNYQAACSLSKVVKSNTKMVILAHLSMDCNIPSLAVSEIESTLFPVIPV